MAISSTERRSKNVQVFVEKDAVETSFTKWAQPGHFSRTLAKGLKTTTWIWKDGSYIEYYENVQIRKDKNNKTIVQYLQTTTGRDLLNYTIQTSLSLN
jgi:hypothetical protein